MTRSPKFIRVILLAFFLVLGAPSRGAAQELERTHSFRLRNVELSVALDSLMAWYSFPLIYLNKDVEGKRIDAECVECDLEAALRKVAEGGGLQWKTVGEQVILTKREAITVGTFAGMIRDSLTGAAVAGAEVILQIRQNVEETEERGVAERVYRWCSVNQFGFFSLRAVRPGDYILRIRRLGYRSIEEPINVREGSTMRDFVMTEQQLAYPEINVEGRRSGFSALEGISRGVYIRATPSDHNQYLLEGARIYNPLHYGGVMSTFSGDALMDVQVIAGGVPSYYGGRIGGVLDVALRDGSGKGLGGAVTAGSIHSNLFLEGPLFKETTFLISGRRGYPDLLSPRYRPDTKLSDLNSFEGIAKVTHHLSTDQQLSLSAYVGQDTYGNGIAGPGGFSNSLRWGNTAVNLRWGGVVSPSLFFYASGIYTRYGFTAGHRLEETGGGLPELFDSDYSIENAVVRAHAEYFYDEFHTVLAGVELVRHRMAGKIDEYSSQIAPMSFDGFSPLELALYFEDQWRLAPSVLAQMGLRATSFVAKQGSFSAVDPRFSLLVSLKNDLRLFTSVSAVNQFVHPYRNSGIFLFYPTIFLYPSTEHIKPSTSIQLSVGSEKTFQNDRYRLAAESYYRTTQKLHEFVFDTTMSASISDALVLGEGEVYGVEVTFDKRAGEFTGSVRYGLSWSSNRFAELNNGNPFRPRFDRRQELYATASYSPHENWSFGLACLLSANEFPTFTPKGVEAQASLDAGLVTRQLQYAEPYDLDGGRLPGFQRIEVRMLHSFSWWEVPFQASLRLLNGYGLVDPFAWQLRSASPDNRLRWKVTFDAPPLFPLYPVVSLSMRF